MSTSPHLRAGSTAIGAYTTSIDPESAGWGYSSLRVLELAPGQGHELRTGDSEWAVLPLTGSCDVSCDGRSFTLAGRRSVFSGVTDFAYLPRDAIARISSAGGGRFALTGARCATRLEFRYGPASGVPVELRGAGQATRQVNNFLAADTFEADRLIAVEVLTPAGNWSSFPPHKHDTEREGESVLEEIYYFEIADGPDGPGMGYQRVYPSGAGHATDVLAEVRSGDAVLIPDGWHGPSMAVPGYDMYYLNVMAGPDPERAWRICDDPVHTWVRDTWAEQAPDPRLPFYSRPAHGSGGTDR
ncbi:5-deoxy-glucuronate isomerase [Nocardiopsis ansamitocini]|uniref:5-deoxy-glucuronate isomerase n=1 Tax=Nocardiopsis ansamitocini TaxID=1670832 RepID=A0A9W6UH64_9ACTN|nr:5-deoxy-glucuronate isomerase [Nocardiopsis ansamitocini]GLU48526.1 5-deoxy-glucuronate isomerase [Nocardiopsis ansamitocini]